ncbi:hypothetical protein [Bradyrhizobium elkanii]|uniref:hypothetical protein n=1 Tax=Bradyrhizobium elkanii TaxID=29448 RepID=UPI0021695B43|nr:hypothetical protein [Bradyrhizobium elkanii]MCS3887674.1 hypothetical protein [Bradyrhizobium elkanii]MCW2213613.1 hypothetical protein [Bradyrhizobium elkanii]
MAIQKRTFALLHLVCKKVVCIGRAAVVLPTELQPWSTAVSTLLYLCAESELNADGMTKMVRQSVLDVRK